MIPGPASTVAVNCRAAKGASMPLPSPKMMPPRGGNGGARMQVLARVKVAETKRGRAMKRRL